ncbi:hypothetical protein StrepF001_21000 [Streptomyces sp. F001]|uniref:hypothetical protein n=1 Tax=Streptomyces sp. F001 TaxID=1510026 RepID=UPI00101E7DF9|nr:hypothetical protein [Streptomyces sp. F001]RZB17239.1 hypothetical protein StrepF001_21000 [Streptomyces sp. F001]
MDILDAINANLSHALVMELTVFDTEFAGLHDCAFRWLTEGVREYAGVDILQSAGRYRISTEGLSRVPALKPHGDSNRWSYVSVAPRDTFEVRYNPYSPQVFPWLKMAIDDRAESITVESGEFTSEGEIGDPDVWISATFDEDLPEYVKLVVHMDEAELLDPGRASDAQDRLLRSARWVCDRYNVVYGHVSYRHACEMTELERFLRGEAGDPTVNTPRWRSELRGYSWLMVISADVAVRLGGADALRESQAFHSVIALPNGSLLLQATPTFREYRGPAVANVYRAVRDVLVTGEFRVPPPMPGVPPAHMVVLPD